ARLLTNSAGKDVLLLSLMCGQSLALFLLIRSPPYVVFMFVVFHGFFVSSLSSRYSVSVVHCAVVVVSLVVFCLLADDSP
ncbi:unnamed protein product, partial [Amoebophrya sp. A120]